MLQLCIKRTRNFSTVYKQSIVAINRFPDSLLVLFSCFLLSFREELSLQLKSFWQVLSHEDVKRVIVAYYNYSCVGVILQVLPVFKNQVFVKTQLAHKDKRMDQVNFLIMLVKARKHHRTSQFSRRDAP